MQSKTDYTPDEFVNKIFADIKDKGLDQDFVIQYTLDDFNKYVTPQNFTYYQEFEKKFKGKNNKDKFIIVILNFQIFDPVKLKESIQKYKTKIPELKEKINKAANSNIFKQLKYLITKEKQKLTENLRENFNKIYDNAANFTAAHKLIDNLKNEYAKNM